MGVLSNEQVEKDNEVKGKADPKEGGYAGSQDTGVDIPPDMHYEKNKKDEKNKNQK